MSSLTLWESLRRSQLLQGPLFSLLSAHLFAFLSALISRQRYEWNEECRELGMDYSSCHLYCNIFLMWLAWQLFPSCRVALGGNVHPLTIPACWLPEWPLDLSWNFACKFWAFNRASLHWTAPQNSCYVCPNVGIQAFSCEVPVCCVLPCVLWFLPWTFFDSFAVFLCCLFVWVFSYLAWLLLLCFGGKLV